MLDDIVAMLEELKVSAMFSGVLHIFVLFYSTFRDEMQYIFLEKSFIFMVFLAVKDAGTDVI